MARVIDNPKQLIINTAKGILFDKGYSELSMRNVAKACGIALGTIYNYFPTKRELVIDMMTAYWREYIEKLEGLINGNNTIFVKLHDIFKELEVFINTFKIMWLRPELYETPDYVENGLAKQSIYMEKLIGSIESLLISETSKTDPEIHLNFDSYETSKFIVLNFITMIQMPSFSYQSFEVFLRTLLR